MRCFRIPATGTFPPRFLARNRRSLANVRQGRIYEKVFFLKIMGRYNRSIPSQRLPKTILNRLQGCFLAVLDHFPAFSTVNVPACVTVTSRLLFTGLEEMWYDKACAGIGEACRILTAAFDGRQNCRVPAVLV